MRVTDVGHLRRAAAELGFRGRDGFTLSHLPAPRAWAKYQSRKSSVLESPLLAYRPQEGTPDMMVADVGSAAAVTPNERHPWLVPYEGTLQVGDVVRATDALTEETTFGAIRKAVRAGTVGVVAQAATSSSAVVQWTGYYDHPLGPPMVMERAEAGAWAEQRQQRGPVRRILPSGKLNGSEQGLLLATGAATSPPGAPAGGDVRSLGGGVTLEAPLASLEVSEGRSWQPLSAAVAQRRQARAAVHAGCLPALRRVSEGRLSGCNPLLGWDSGSGFLRPGADTSMVVDAPVLAFDGAGVGREFNLLYIDEEAEYAVVGMGSASGALYSANVSLRMLPLADVYLPTTRLVAPSLPVGRLLDGPLGDALARLHAADDGPLPGRPSFEYHGRPLPPGDTSLWASLRALFGGGGAFDGGVSTARAWERLRSELVELRGREAVRRAAEEQGHGTIELPLDLFCVRLGRRQLPVYIGVGVGAGDAD